MNTIQNSQISSGVAHTLVCTASGNIFAFGSSRYGQIGSGQESNLDLPFELGKVYPNHGPFDQLPMLSEERIIHVSAGYHHSAAVSSRGVLYTWGRDSEGCLGHGSEPLHVGPWSNTIRSRFLPCAVKTFLQEKIITGSSASIKPKVGNAKIRIAIARVSCGSEHTLAVDVDGYGKILLFSNF